jgi:prohibitin 1
MKYTSILLLLLVLTSGCSVIDPGQVGVKRTLGKLSSKVSQPGPVVFNPFISKVVRLNVGTMNLAIKENLPSKEGLTILSESSILFHIKAADAPRIIQETGLNFEDNLILPVFRSAASDVCSRYYAKDMHSAKRNEIEKEIQARLAEVCDAKGFVIEAVLLKSITLPAGLTENECYTSRGASRSNAYRSRRFCEKHRDQSQSQQGGQRNAELEHHTEHSKAQRN